MKGIKFCAAFILFFTLLSSCKKDKPDERIYGRWKITEYYLDGQPAFDTIVKYLDSLEYEIWELNAPAASYAGGNVAIKIHGLEGIPPIRFEDMGSDGLTMQFNNTKVPAPVCLNAPNSTGCFECPGGWYYKVINDNKMQWTARNTTSYPISHQHRLIFIRIN